jgi:hypothetical protein
METLRIRDLAPEGYLSFDLIDILNECGAYMDRRWIAWGVEWSSRYDFPDSELELLYLECYKRLREAPDGQVEMSFSQLVECANSVNQTEEGFFLAVRPDIDVIAKLDRLSDFERIADLIIHAFDFTFWEVTTSDKLLIEKLSSKFHDTAVHPIMMEGGSNIPR